MFDLLDKNRFARAVEHSLPVHRERLCTPLRTLALFVGQTLS